MWNSSCITLVDCIKSDAIVYFSYNGRCSRPCIRCNFFIEVCIMMPPIGYSYCYICMVIRQQTHVQLKLATDTTGWTELEKNACPFVRIL